MKILVFLIAFAAAKAQENSKIYYYPATYNNLGCWKSFTGTSREWDRDLFGNYKHRSNAIVKCAVVAFKYGDDVFALQDGGLCLSSAKARENYRQNGPSKECSSDGKGGLSTFQVYEIKSISKVLLDDLGCWGDSGGELAIPTLEGLDPILDGYYWKRHEAIQKCLQAAYNRGYLTITLQYNGRCSGTRNAKEKLNRYGYRTQCPALGRGGSSANHFYHMHVIWTTNF